MPFLASRSPFRQSFLHDRQGQIEEAWVAIPLHIRQLPSDKQSLIIAELLIPTTKAKGLIPGHTIVAHGHASDERHKA